MARSAVVGGILLALIEGVGIMITRMTAEQFKPGWLVHETLPLSWLEILQGVPKKLCPVCLKIATKQQKILPNLFHDVVPQMFN